VTELLAACAFNNIANGVGPFSFTHALISQLRKLVHMPSFTVGYLFNLLLTEIQSWRLEDSRHKKAPVHLVLSQDHRLPRSITLSAKKPLQSSRNTVPAAENINLCKKNLREPLGSTSSSSQSSVDGGISPFSSDRASSSTSRSLLPEYPRLLFSIRISEDIKPRELSTELFADWLGILPIAAKSIRVEAGFASDSTLLMVSMPVGLLQYLPKDPAMMVLGTIKSSNLLTGIDNEPVTWSMLPPIQTRSETSRGPHTTGHGRIATATRFDCAECSRSLRSKAGLLLHAMETQHQPYACECGSRFSRLDVLNRHLESIDTREPKFPCKYCKLHRGADGFWREDNLMQHMRNYQSVPTEHSMS
jgi:hypothetical protein